MTLAPAPAAVRNPLYAAWLDAVAASRRRDWAAQCISRVDAVRRWAWAVPDPDTLQRIAGLADGGLVEVGAGTGYWAAQLAAMGVDIIASDIGGQQRQDYFAHDATFHPVVQADAAEFAACHAHRTLLLVWPPYATSMGADAVEAYWLAGGRRVLFVGEYGGGCTGDDRMHALLGDEWAERMGHTSARFRHRAAHEVAQWYGINDWLIICERIDYRELGR